MIDFTPAQSREYSKLLEAEGPSQDAIDYQALQVLRGLSALDISEVMMEVADGVKACMLQGMGDRRVGMMQGLGDRRVGMIVRQAILDYCERIARRELEA